jgi:mannitol/fructose-specific phosphotransferase system IIA component (Ntr-type)
VFIAIVFSAVFSSVIMGPWITRSIARRRRIAPAQFLAPETVIPELTGTNREEIIIELANVIARQAKVPNAQVIIDRAMKREQQFSTALRNGIAIPHARIHDLKTPIIAFGRTRDAIPWDNPDDLPVKDVFFIATPPGAEDVQLNAFASIAEILASRESRARIDNAADAASLFHVLKELLVKEKPGRHMNKHAQHDGA